ncbi:MAG: hypothetical protein ILP19_01645, partial [Oscillospiraceae bacterium]|nr:hypothetical protein [Oscillospiraceae bacterium]
VILGLLPYIITMAAAPYIPPQVMIGLVFFSVMEVAAALGDVVNAYNCIKQVPGGAKVFNRGYHSYWIK